MPHRKLDINMKNKLQESLAVLSLLFMSHEAISCEIENIFKGKLELEIINHKDYESAIIKQGEMSAIKGEIAPARGWDIKNIEGETIGAITDDLIVVGMDDDCERGKTKLKKVEKNKYQIIENNVSIGEIKGRFPK